MIDFDALEQTPQQSAPAPQKKEKVSKKKTEKKPAPAKKAAAKKKPAKPAAPAEKYHVVESEKQDEHDKLKPRSNPVPAVKIISLDVHKKEKSETAEKVAVKENDAEKALETEKAPASVAVPAAPAAVDAPFAAVDAPFATAPAAVDAPPAAVDAPFATAPAAVDAPPAAAAPVKNDEKTRDVIVNAEKAVEKIVGQVMRKNAEKQEERGQFEAEKENPFIAAASLSDAKRSAALLKNIPDSAAGRKMLSDKTLLRDVILFEQNATAVEASSEKTLEALTDFLLKNPSKRIIVFTYAAPSDVETGRERQLTLRRALYMRSRLAQAGVKIARIEIRSQGTKGAGDDYPDRAEIYTYDR